MIQRPLIRHEEDESLEIGTVSCNDDGILEIKLGTHTMVHISLEMWAWSMMQWPVNFQDPMNELPPPGKVFVRKLSASGILRLTVEDET